MSSIIEDLFYKTSYGHYNDNKEKIKYAEDKLKEIENRMLEALGEKNINLVQEQRQAIEFLVEQKSLKSFGIGVRVGAKISNEINNDGKIDLDFSLD